MKVIKNFVLDTNVILHDHNCLKSFQDNDLFIPLVVLEELDRFKKGTEQLNFNARAFIRELELITDNNLFTQGVSLGSTMGRLFVIATMPVSELIKSSFPEKKSDNMILAATDSIAHKYPNRETTLVTKDLNLRMKARSIGLKVADYNTDKVALKSIFDQDHLVMEGVSSELIDQIYGAKEGVSIEELSLPTVVANECFILKSERSSVLVRFNPFLQTVQRIIKTNNYGIEARNAEQAFAFEVLNDPTIKLVALTGKAGTGKTLLALAAALGKLDTYKQVLLARPIVSLSNKDLGFLPGDAQAKVSPYMQPLFDNLTVIKRQFSPNSQEVKAIDEMLKSEQLVIEALAFIRGRSLSSMYCIVDEAQNLTPHEIKTIITRAGEGTKMVFTGDISQIDHPYLDTESSGLTYLIDKMKGQHLFAHVNLIKGERSELSELASNLM